MKVLAVVQARMGSTRLPNKVMRKLVGTPMIEVLLQRLMRSRRVSDIVVATSYDPRNEPLAEHVRRLGVKVFVGSENDVLERFYQAALTTRPDVVVRITGDCPLVDAELVDTLIEEFSKHAVDYCSNVDPPSFPDGLDIEVFSFAALERTRNEATAASDREHVSPYMRREPSFRRHNVCYSEDLSSLRWTVDELSDFAVVERVFHSFKSLVDFSWKDVLEFQRSHPEIFNVNQHLLRNQGAETSTGQKLWKRAKQVIPGGNMLLSKRAEMHLPEQWPAYFSKAKGCRVWDLDGRQYIDASLMGVGTNVLGYGHTEVDDSVLSVVANGNMATLNCPEEVYLAERLVEINPWAGMVRLARTGGEANAVAVRIARAASGRDKVAFCGYHGWHDWYLAANLGDGSNLAGHLLPGLKPAGVPQSLRGSVLPFEYNNIAQLELLVQENSVGVIKMEVMRNRGPENDFLQKVREIATRNNIVLIFDECTSGFRQTFGGLYLDYGVEPDIAVYGKTLGNGYAISAVVGRRAVMEAAQETFVSSTFWTERIGPAAALKALEVMERLESWKVITSIGRTVSERWKELASRHGLKITTSGLPALSTFAFEGSNSLAYKTLLTQEMLSRGYLATTGMYVCIAHTEDILKGYFDALDEVFGIISRCENGCDVKTLLKGPICHAGFRRLN